MALSANTWDSLTTTDDFDKGSDQDGEIKGSTKLIGGELMRGGTGMVKTPVSLLVQSLIQQLCTMLEEDNTKATNLYFAICKNLHDMKLLDQTYTMGEFEFIRSQYQAALQQLVKVVNNDKLPIQIKDSSSALSSSIRSWSRYCRDFQEVGYIARGGFGQVYVAKHKLDEVSYAIKKICIKACDLKSVLHHLSEVKTFAGLDHPNIVSYKSAWLEPLLENNGNEIHHNGDSVNEMLSDHSSSSYLSQNTRNEETTNESDFQISFRENVEVNSLGQTNETFQQLRIVRETAESCKAVCKLDDKNKQLRLSMDTPHINLKWATLYIQMSLCHQTMKAWLEERNKNRLDLSNLASSSKELPLACSSLSYIEIVKDIFIQLSRGLNYIHGRKIVHHDIKPSNIFIESHGSVRSVKLGDFGLACPLENSPHGGVGTKLYAAPEQLEGNCNLKSDLYSMGLILMELLESYGTEMEKIKYLNEVREGIIPVHIERAHPQLANIISKLVEQRAEIRIDSNELLRLLDNVKENKDETIKILRADIDQLRQQLNKKNEEILRLKKLLEQR